MPFPRLKNARLCRVLVYVAVLGGWLFPMVVAANLRFFPEIIRIFAAGACMIGLLVYLMKNYVVLMTMDLGLAMLHCHQTARKRFGLPHSFSVERVEKRVSRFGRAGEAAPVVPRPGMLRYRSSAPITIYSGGTEEIIATFHPELLDKRTYQSIVNSAVVSANALKGKKRRPVFERVQKAAPIHQVTVVLIFAKNMDETFRNGLFETVCKHTGDGAAASVLPCVVDLEERTCTFDSMRIPYTGCSYPVKNRGIRIIRKYVFHNKLPLSRSPEMLAPMQSLDPEQSLWSFWRETKRELLLREKEYKKRFEKMGHGEILPEGDALYLKWKDRGVCLSVQRDDERKTAEIDGISSWDYPKPNIIAKDTVKEMKGVIDAYFARLGYTTQYILREEER